MNKNTLKDVFSVIKEELMFNEPFYGFFIATLDKIIVKEGHPRFKEIPTAAVAPASNSINYNLFINENFWWSLKTTALKAAILKHEVDHIIYFHPTMAKNFSDKIIFNIAADLTINQNIIEIKNMANDMSLEEYLDFIKENKEKIETGEVTPPFRPCLLEDYGFDESTEYQKGTQYYYNRLVEKRDQNDEVSKLIQQVCNSIAQGDPLGENHQTWKDFDRESDSFDNIMDQQVKGIVKQILDDNKSTLYGNLPGHLRDLIDEIVKDKKPVVNWKKVLRHFSSYSTEYYTKPSRRKLNKRVEEFSSIRLYTKKKLFIGLDTSGSMSDNDIKECFAEVHNIWKSGVAVTVGECDAQLDRKNDVYEYKGSYPKMRKGISGGGGTSCSPLVDYVNDNLNKYTCFVYLTDGYLPPPANPCKKPMLTILTSSGAEPEDLGEGFGKIIKMQPNL